MIEAINGFVRGRMRLARQEIATLAAESIRGTGEVVATFGHSSAVAEAFERAWNGPAATAASASSQQQHDGGKRFSVLVVDARPRHDGRKRFSRLRAAGIPCELTHIAALPMFASKVGGYL